MKNFQKIAAFVIASLVIITGCKKSFLDVPPQGQPAETQFWKTSADATSAVNSMYANLHG